MKYSLITDTRASSESFNTLKKVITELYPDFSFEKTVRTEGESEMAVYARGDERICAEINYENREVRVSSDIPMPELAEFFKLSKKAATKEYVSDRINLRPFKNPRFWKYVIIPAALLLASTIICVVSSFPYFDFEMLILPLLMPVMLVGIFAPALGWIWFIPVLPAAIAAACFKKEKLYKLIVTAMPLLSAVRLCIAYPDICAELYESIPYIPEALLYAFFVIVIVLFIIYVLALPYMITDDIAGAVCEHSGGKRPRKRFSALCWTVSVIVSITAVCISGHFAVIENKIEEEERITVLAEEREDRSREYDRIYEEYGADMTAVAEYSAEHRYYDWYNCPDPVMKSVWERLFLSENAYSDLAFSEEEGYVQISFGSFFTYQIYPDMNEVRYNGKTISYGGETV
ncbi:MAG: hypothetical protein K2K44_13415 [Oscillospiraceae bacterium]|nr:hypothetical protein [Oscillospiraceae bacterium]